VVLNRLDTDEQLAGHLSVALPRANEPRDVPLLLGERAWPDGTPPAQTAAGQLAARQLHEWARPQSAKDLLGASEMLGGRTSRSSPAQVRAILQMDQCPFERQVDDCRVG